MKFFIPHLVEDPAGAEREWSRYVAESSADPASRRVRPMIYEHEDSRYEVSIGQRRRRFRRRRGPRGGHIKNAEFAQQGSEAGTMVSGIVHAGHVIHVWSYGPPFGGWANPSFVGPGSVTSIEFCE